MSPDLIDAAVANGAKGLVVAGVGDGNMTTPALEAIKRAIGKGVVVVRSTRVGDGIVRRNIEVEDDKIGTVASKELNPAKSRVLLKLALTQTTDPKKVQEFFDKVLRRLGRQETMRGCRDAASVRDAQPVRDQKRPCGRCHEDRPGRAGGLPQRRARQSELGRHRAAVGLLPARPVRDHREPAHDEPSRRSGGHAAGTWRRFAPDALAPGARGPARRELPAARHSLGHRDVRVRSGCLRPRAGRFDYRRQLSGPRPDARPQRADRARVPCSGRCAATRARQVPSSCTLWRVAPPRCATSSSPSRPIGC